MNDFYSILNEESKNIINESNLKYKNDELAISEAISDIIRFNAEVSYNETVFAEYANLLLEENNNSSKTVNTIKFAFDTYAKVLKMMGIKIKKVFLKFMSTAKLYISKFIADNSINKISQFLNKYKIEEIDNYPISNIYEVCNEKKILQLNLPSQLKYCSDIKSYVECAMGQWFTNLRDNETVSDSDKIIALNTYLQGINFFNFVNCLGTEVNNSEKNQYEKYKENIKNALSNFKYKIYDNNMISYKDVLNGYKKLNSNAKELVNNSYHFIDSFINDIACLELSCSKIKADDGKVELSNALGDVVSKFKITDAIMNQIKGVLNDTISISNKLISYLYKTTTFVAKENLRIRKYLKTLMLEVKKKYDNPEVEKATGEIDGLLLLTDKSQN